MSERKLIKSDIFYALNRSKKNHFPHSFTAISNCWVGKAVSFGKNRKKIILCAIKKFPFYITQGTKFNYLSCLQNLLFCFFLWIKYMSEWKNIETTMTYIRLWNLLKLNKANMKNMNSASWDFSVTFRLFDWENLKIKFRP